MNHVIVSPAILIVKWFYFLLQNIPGKRIYLIYFFHPSPYYPPTCCIRVFIMALLEYPFGLSDCFSLTNNRNYGWIGLYQCQGQWIWLDGTVILEPIPWAPNAEPDSPREACAAIHKEDGLVYTLDCTSNHLVICSGNYESRCKTSI